MDFRSQVVLRRKPSAVRSAILGVFLLYSSTDQAFAVEPRDCSAATTARNLQEAHAHLSRAEYAPSEHTFAGVLACQKQSLSANDLQIAVTLGNLGELKRLQRQFKAAEMLLKEAISIHETEGRTAAGPTANVAFGTALLTLASVYKDRKQYPLAEPLVQRAMQVFDLTPGPDSREAAAALNTLAVLHAQSGDFDTAERHLRAAIARRQNSPPDVSIATAQHNLGAVLFEAGRVGEAEQWLLRALDLRSRLLGTHHPATRLTLQTYEKLLRRTGRKEEARRTRTHLRSTASVIDVAGGW